MSFYYHYFITEKTAIASLLAQAGMYALIEIVLWAWYTVKSQQPAPKFLSTVLVTVGLLLAVEISKFMMPSKHPDSMNILIDITSAPSPGRLPTVFKVF